MLRIHVFEYHCLERTDLCPVGAYVRLTTRCSFLDIHVLRGALIELLILSLSAPEVFRFMSRR